MGMITIEDLWKLPRSDETDELIRREYLREENRRRYRDTLSERDLRIVTMQAQDELAALEREPRHVIRKRWRELDEALVASNYRTWRRGP